MKKVFYNALYFFVLFALSLVTMLYVFQDNMLYIPSSPAQYPHENGKGYENPSQMELEYYNLTL